MGLFGQHTCQQAIYVWREPCHKEAWARWWFLGMCKDKAWCCTRKRHPPSDNLICHDAEGVEVTLPIYMVGFNLFWREIFRGAHECASAGELFGGIGVGLPCDAKVGE